MAIKTKLISEAANGTIKVAVSGTEDELRAIQAAEDWLVEQEGCFIQFYRTAEFSGPLSESVYGNYAAVSSYRHAATKRGYVITVVLRELQWKHYKAAGYTLPQMRQERKHLSEQLSGLPQGNKALQRRPGVELGGLTYKAKKIAARVRARLRGPKPKRSTNPQSAPPMATTTKKAPATKTAAAKKKAPATKTAVGKKKTPATKKAATKTPAAKKATTGRKTATQRKAAAVGKKPTTTRKKATTTRKTAAAAPARKKSVVKYPYKKVELREALEKKGFGIDKEISKSADAVRRGLKNGSGAHLRRQGLKDKKSRMRRGSLAGTGTAPAKRRSTKKVGVAKRDPNFKLSAAQKKNLHPNTQKGLLKYHHG